MYSLTTRLNSVFFFGVTCLALLAILNILSTYFQTATPTIKNFSLSKEYSLYTHPYTKVQHYRTYFNLDVDFTPVFNWNNNLIFMWISAEYNTGRKQTQKTTVTVYDKILLRNNTAVHHLNFKEKLFEYPLVDYFDGLKNKEVKLSLHFEHAPVVGPIIKKSVPLHTFTIPSEIKVPSKRHMRTEIDYENIKIWENYERQQN